MSTQEIDSRPLSADSRVFSLLDLLLALAKHKRLLVGLPVLVGALALVVGFVLPKWYTAAARIMPPQQSQSNAVAILGQLGALAGGVSQGLGLRNPSDVYVAMLKSRTIADALIKRFDLMKLYDEDTLVETRKELLKRSSIVAAREGIITIEVEDKSAQRAADIANAYVEELRNITLSLAVSEASQRRLFFEGQLKKSKTDLANAEGELKRFTSQAGLVSPQGQVSLAVGAAAALRAQIAAKEIQLTAMRSFATENNPDLIRTAQELVGLRAEMAKMEKNANASKGDVFVPFGQASEMGLEYIRKYRDVKYYETLFEVLAKQYEIARIDEAKDATLIQALDPAIAPDKRSWPKPWLFSVLGLLSGLLVAIVAAITIEAVKSSLENDLESSTRLRQIVQLLSPKSRRQA